MENLKGSELNIRNWTKSTFWGWLLGVVLIIVISSFLDSIGIEHMQFYVGVGMGAGVGLSQWLLLKKQIDVNANWIVASVIGLGLPFLLLDLWMNETSMYKLPVGVALGGLAVGLLQFNILKKHFSNPTPWVIGSFAGWCIAGLIVMSINYTMNLKGAGMLNLIVAILNLVIILSGGIILGIVSGNTFKKLH